jgi:DNA-binding PadR family transcriptional regulator
VSLPHALLTTLVERPCTGAELVRRFDRSIGYFWQATHQQIYRELGRLDEAGWVASEPASEGPGRQRCYRVLPAGRRELKRWITTQDKPVALRDALMVRLRAEAVLGPSGLDTMLRHRIEQQQRKLQEYLSIEAREFSADVDTRERKLQHMVLKSGVAALRTRIETALEILQVLALPPSR